MEKDTLTSLAEKYLNGTATEAERKILHEWYDDWQDEVEYIYEGGAESEEDTRKRLLKNLQKAIRHRKQPKVIGLRRTALIACAASMILVVAGWYLFSQRGHRDTVIAASSNHPAYKQDVLPGSNKAILRLASGATIALDSAANGPLAQQGNVRVVKLANGQIVYLPGEGGDSKVSYNTMSIPRGGQYRLVLPDGTNVWLNAESSITYPTAFVGAERRISITGEAYFEVTKNIKMPFIVTSGNASVHVLGTNFNINAYEDDHMIRTTLLEGSVRIGRNGDGVIIRPGEQAGVSADGNINVSKVDVQEVIAWKNGLFQFTKASIENIMQQLSRWYDIEVVYDGNKPTDRFSGEVPRSANLSVILNVLHASGTKFSIEGKRIIVRS